ncbi:nuclear telomere cap complex subunit Ten1 [Aspergillus lucknowensis]|uniref:CST complex subunit Ten1 n=1 Tax=Aspergillus lucknowensis TaxID=176173 RepID=A0ABR4LQF3_9EURO
MNGPLPSTRVFLSDIPSLPADSKVRFLGCVKTYHISTGHLVLEHNYPRVKVPQSNRTQGPPSISVDINAILETVTWEELCVGAWVNVVGYVRKGPSTTSDEKREFASASASASSPDSVFVDAVLILPAGAIDLGEYERILCDLREVERMGRAVDWI